ncbi:MAG: hypothetical protein WEB06_04285 [Actinomycetota bacterium]
MRFRALLMMVAFAVVGGVLVLGGSASAHECTDDPETEQTPDECHETPVQPNWRGTYIPLFDLEDREDESQRYDAQRWRDECNTGDPNSDTYQSRQLCAWFYGGTSGSPGEDGELAPNELHAGFAATHCFLFEAAHQCEDGHDGSIQGEGVHDAHGGATYVDVCLQPNPDSKYCNDGMEDTQAGVTVMDHFACGTVVPVASCTDEYHVVRPLDQEYTQAQMDNSVEQTQEIADDPYTWLCGYGEYGGDDCIVPQP